MASQVPATVFLDRDGTINREVHYLSDPDQLELLPAVAPALRRLQQVACRLIVITNQSPIGRGIFNEARLLEIHARLDQILQAEGVAIDAWYWCPHQPKDHCVCRKPRTGMFEQAKEDFDMSPQTTWVIGDKLSDVEAGRRFGSTTILVGTGYGEREWLRPESRQWVDYFVPTLAEAADTILETLAVPSEKLTDQERS